MYDFYGNPPKTKQDLRDWLMSWLEKPTPEPVSLLQYKEEEFQQELGFRRGYHIHGVFRNTKTNEYVWWVFEEKDLNQFPLKRYASYEALLEGVIEDYYKTWKLTD